MRTVFIHGAGSSGAQAWPKQASGALPGEDFRFLERIVPGDNPSEVVTKARGEVGATAHVVGHSYGSITALLLAHQRRASVATLILVEPALPSIARGWPGVEAHVQAMAPVLAHRHDPNVTAADFSRLFAAASGMPIPDVPLDVLENNVARLRAIIPPWEINVDPTVVSTLPTLVLTGGWNAMYEEIATVLKGVGADHVVLEGFRHRVQDHPDALPTMRAFWTRHET